MGSCDSLLDVTIQPDSIHSGPIKPVRTKPVLIGTVMAWLGGIVGLIAGVYFLIPRLASEQILDVGLDPELLNAFTVLGSLVALWSVLTLVGATAAFKGYRWGSIVLLLVATLASFVLMFGAAASGSFELFIPLAYILIATAMFFLPVSTYYYRASYRYRTA